MYCIEQEYALSIQARINISKRGKKRDMLNATTLLKIKLFFLIFLGEIKIFGSRFCSLEAVVCNVSNCVGIEHSVTH